MLAQIKSCLDNRRPRKIASQSLYDAKRIVVIAADTADKGWVKKAIDFMDQNVIGGYPVGGQIPLFQLDCLYNTPSICRSLESVYEYDSAFRESVEKALKRRLLRKHAKPIIFKYVGYAFAKRVKINSVETMAFGHGILLKQAKVYLREELNEYRSANPYKQTAASDFLPCTVPGSLSNHRRMQLSQELLTS